MALIRLVVFVLGGVAGLSVVGTTLLVALGHEPPAALVTGVAVPLGCLVGIPISANNRGNWNGNGGTPPQRPNP